MSSKTSLIYRFMWMVPLVALSLLGACGGGGGDAAGFGFSAGDVAAASGSGSDGSALADAPYKQNVDRVFEGVDSSNRKIVLFLEKVEPSGDFSGKYGGSSHISRTQLDAISSSNDIDVAGTYKNRKFTITETGSALSYTGTFVTDDLIVLATNAPAAPYSVRLARNANGAFVPHMSAVWTFPAESKRRIQLSPKQGFTDEDVTLLIEGTEFLDGSSAPVVGYASVTEVSLQISRTTGVVRLSGSLRKSNSGKTGDVLDFTDGSLMQRSSADDAANAVAPKPGTPGSS